MSIGDQSVQLKETQKVHRGYKEGRWRVGLTKRRKLGWGAGGKGKPTKHFLVHFYQVGKIRPGSTLSMCEKLLLYSWHVSPLCNPELWIALLQIPLSASRCFTSTDLLVGEDRPSHQDAGECRVFSVCVYFTALFSITTYPSKPLTFSFFLFVLVLLLWGHLCHPAACFIQWPINSWLTSPLWSLSFVIPWCLAIGAPSHSMTRSWHLEKKKSTSQPVETEILSIILHNQWEHFDNHKQRRSAPLLGQKWKHTKPDV